MNQAPESTPALAVGVDPMSGRIISPVIDTVVAATLGHGNGG